MRHFALPDFVSRLIPFVELDWFTPAAGPAPFYPETITIAPGVIYVGNMYQVGLEALMPGNKASGPHLGAILQVHFFFDDMFPKTPGRPLLQWPDLQPLKEKTMHRIRSCALAAAFLLASAGAALAHAFPTTTNPPVGSTLKTAPHEVVINYTEGIIPNFSSLEVVHASGGRVDRDDAHLGPAGAKQFVVDLGPLPPATYKVIWHATSVDTHKTQGSFNFTVAP